MALCPLLDSPVCIKVRRRLAADAELMMRVRGASELLRGALHRGMRGARTRDGGLLSLEPLGPPTVLPLVVPRVAEVRRDLAREHIDVLQCQFVRHRPDLQ